MSHTINYQIDDVITQYVELSPEVRRAVRLCNEDLYNGPIYYVTPDGDTKFWGEEPEDGDARFDFSEMLSIVRDAFDDVRTLYVDLDCGWVGNREPEGYMAECWKCSGTGVSDEIDEDGEQCECKTCHGDKEVWEEPSEYYEVDDVARRILGRELAALL